MSNTGSNMPLEAAGSSLKPRLATSRQWTALPTDFVKKVRAVYEGQFPIETDNGEFMIEGRIYPEEIVIRIGYLENGRLKQINFEASMDLPARIENVPGSLEDSEERTERESKTMERLYVCIDALGSVLEEYFELGEPDEEEEGIDIPLHWRAYQFDGETVYLQHSTVNTKLEAEADRILGLGEKRLFQEEAPTEDALAKAEIDSELAFEVQKLIRAGKFPRPVDAHGAESESEDFEN